MNLHLLPRAPVKPVVPDWGTQELPTPFRLAVQQKHKAQGGGRSFRLLTSKYQEGLQSPTELPASLSYLFKAQAGGRSVGVPCGMGGDSEQGGLAGLPDQSLHPIGWVMVSGSSQV